MSKCAQVKYKKEGIRASVPTDFFKVVFEGTVGRSELELGSVYDVFWSPEEEETPQDVADDGNDIVCIDLLSEKEYAKLYKTNGNKPMKGYYNAVLLAMSDTEEVPNTVIKRELSGSNCLPDNTKRKRAPSTIALEAQASKNEIKKRAANNKEKGHKGNVKADKNAVASASKRNLSGIFAACENVKKSEGVEYHADAEYWKQKYLTSLQGSSSNNKGKAEEKSGSLGDNDLDSIFDLDRAEDEKKAEEKETKTVQDPSDKSDSDESTDSNGNDKDEILQSSKKKKVIPKGQAGDSLAVFAEMNRLWSPATLVKRSATGLPASQRKGATPYPELTPQKKKECEDLLKKRVLEENPSASSDEINTRVSRLHYIMGQKIAGVGKSFRSKKMVIPSAEDAKEEAKRERKKLRKQKKTKAD